MLHGYLELKLSWELFKKAPESLTEPERDRLCDIADRQDSIEQRILGSSTAGSVVIPAATVKNRLDEIRKTGEYAALESHVRELLRIADAEQHAAARA